MLALTGAPYHVVDLGSQDGREMVDSGMLWPAIQTCINEKSIVTATAREGGHACHVIGLLEGTYDGETLRLLKIRCLGDTSNWARDGKYNGVKRSTQWTDDAESCVVCLTLEEAICIFDTMNFFFVRSRSHNGVKWFDQRRPVEYSALLSGEAMLACLYEITLENASEVFLTVHQHPSVDYLDVGICVLRCDPEKLSQVHAVAVLSPCTVRQNQLQIDSGMLPAGRYLVVPTTSGNLLREKNRDTPYYTHNCVLSVHSSKAFSLDEVPFSKELFAAAVTVSADSEEMDTVEILQTNVHAPVDENKSSAG
jgi:hypothetical protein